MHAAKRARGVPRIVPATSLSGEVITLSERTMVGRIDPPGCPSRRSPAA